MEESSGVEIRATNGPKSDIELSRKAEKVEYSTNVRAPNAEHSFVREFV